MKIKLATYQLFDSTKIAEKRAVKNQKLHAKNKLLLEKQDKINEQRITAARADGKKFYTEKIIPLKDTVNPRRFFREWIKYKLGEPPVIYDSILKNRSVEQINIYMKRKGFYFAKVSSSVDTVKTKKITVNYKVITGDPYIIDSDSLITDTYPIRASYRNYKSKSTYVPLKGKIFDAEYLEEERNKIANYFRNDLFYGLSPSYITYLADTTKADSTNLKVQLRIVVANKFEKDPEDSEKLIEKKHRQYFIGDVHFHLSDSTYFEGNYNEKVLKDSIDSKLIEFLPTYDTIVYSEIEFDKKQKIERKIDPSVDSLNPNRRVTVHYNGLPIVRPEILELQNYLESGNPYREYYVERSFSSLLQLNTFQIIKPEFIERKDTNLLDLHYHLSPSKRQGFYVEPRLTSSSGFLGISSSINYTNKNLFRGSEKLTVSFSGGLESQPAIFDQTLDGEKAVNASRSFNTFEIGPSVTLDLPGLFPVSPMKLSKRHRPRTIISTAYNLQKRRDFDRNIFQLNYLYKFQSTDRTQVFQVGLPFATIKYVLIDKSEAFQNRIDLTNDLFLRNAYNNQFIMQDVKLTYEYSNKLNIKRVTNTLFRFNTSFDHAGGLLALLTQNGHVNENGQHTVFQVPFSQFVRLDNEFVMNKPIGKDQSFNVKLAAGAGLPYGNTKTSMPFDYSFFSGGSNDNRGWRARALGPGSYSQYLDSLATATQIGDIRLGAFIEYRFPLSSIFKSAVYLDASNVWTTKKDENRPGGQFSKNFYKEFAVALGTGIRLDLDFFVIRVDVGFPIYNPALPESSRFIWSSREAFKDAAKEYWGDKYESKVAKPFVPAVQLGIGYPF